MSKSKQSINSSITTEHDDNRDEIPSGVVYVREVR